MTTWQCVKSCGACCYLNPEERPDLDRYLTPDQLQLYLSLIGADGWCIHYDASDRRCRIYSTRPDFCRVTAATFEAMFDLDPADLNDFAIDCCQQHIGDRYGEESPEMARFNQAVGVSPGEEPLSL
ncbi:MAG TPA: YkgJ family cysteine cluster protein [Leptolyngbyaceae cyanobacterium M65_K2018_010]|nr:YkgJ family cysteine cluster protein [Leptolyngbyaceae cyanobacterium M65_K2018_010]